MKKKNPILAKLMKEKKKLEEEHKKNKHLGLKSEAREQEKQAEPEPDDEPEEFVRVKYARDDEAASLALARRLEAEDRAAVAAVPPPQAPAAAYGGAAPADLGRVELDGLGGFVGLGIQKR